MTVMQPQQGSGHEMQAPKFDWTINLGHVAMIVTMGLTMAGAYTAYKVSISEHETRINYLEAQSKSQIQTNSEIMSSVYSIQRDVAVIKDRLERPQK